MNVTDVAKRSGLKELLDKIDRETFARGKNAYMECKSLEFYGQWLKGDEILRAYPDLEQGGGGVCTSFREIEELTGRDRRSLSKWVKIFLALPNKKAALTWAKEQAAVAATRWEAGMLPAPKGNGVATPIPPDGKFSVILADPPWRYDFSPTDSRQIENQYPTMEMDAICELGVSMPFADDAALFLWATAPKLREALQVIDAWGFKYVTHAVWDKEIIGMGYWFRGQHEPLLVATRGTFPPPPESTRVSSIIRSRRAIHSEKPEAVYALIESAYADLSDKQRLEIFARSSRPGWTSWGNEVQSAAA